MIKVDYAVAKENLNKYLNDVTKNDEWRSFLARTAIRYSCPKRDIGH